MMFAKMTYSTKVLVFAVVFSQMFFWNWRNCTARGEAENGEGNESTNSKENAEITCNGPYFKEYCPEDMPCCFWDGKNRTCKAAIEEGEECTHDALGYNTKSCFCKKGLFCANSKCTSEVPTDLNDKDTEMFKK
ncbi:uncharacterized protein LOC129968642 [Argiope bruennichi]|uniref:uncharacterized protein LOC129968642 n=1 Tax=Argiope bruennichi TaxID=94029 RepID=UPI00249460BE|nr:uncharacterized protein LOC129968642 [Argiope bruennichi]